MSSYLSAVFWPSDHLFWHFPDCKGLAPFMFFGTIYSILSMVSVVPLIEGSTLSSIITLCLCVPWGVFLYSNIVSLIVLTELMCFLRVHLSQNNLKCLTKPPLPWKECIYVFFGSEWITQVAPCPWGLVL